MTSDAEAHILLVDRIGTDGRVARVTLNRPEKLNSLSPDLLEDLRSLLQAMEFDRGIRVIVVRGSGRAFSTGYDIGGGPARSGHPSDYDVHRTDERGTLVDVRTNMVRISDFYLYLWNMAKVTIAQVHGYCLAGGVELAMVHDLVVASEDAVFGHPGTRGLGTSRTAAIWPLVIGMRKSKELLYTGDNVSAREALQTGMINSVVPSDMLDAEVERIADRIAIQSADSLALQKRSVNAFYEAMGIHASVHAATDTDAMYQSSRQGQIWQEKVRESGMREAVRWRDNQYRERDKETHE
jgi:enoyl-CoA hydratase